MISQLEQLASAGIRQRAYVGSRKVAFHRIATYALQDMAQNGLGLAPDAFSVRTYYGTEKCPGATIFRCELGEIIVGVQKSENQDQACVTLVVQIDQWQQTLTEKFGGLTLERRDEMCDRLREARLRLGMAA